MTTLTSPTSRTAPGRFSFAALLAGLMILLFGAPSAHAHASPPGCTGSGLGILLFTDSPDVHIGDTLNYSVTVFNGTGNGPVVCDATSITAQLTTPDGVNHPITLRNTSMVNGQSDYYSNIVSYVVRAQDVQPDGTVRATASDSGVIHQNDTDSQGGGNQGVNTEVSLPCIQLLVQCNGSVGENGAITFSGTVTNCGNNTLVGVTVTEFVNGGQFPVTFITNLLAGQIAPFSGSWIPSNPCASSTATFTASGTDQFTTHPRTVTNSASTTCSEVLTPGIKVTKACPAQPPSPGQLLIFSGSVSNTGNVTLTNIVVVNNQPVANTPVFTLSSLAPGATANFSGSYTAPANCSVADTLTASATSRCGVLVTSTASANCPILTTPQLAVTAACPVSAIVPGGSIAYTGTVRNSGDITLTNVNIFIDRPSPNTLVAGFASLAPGASANYTTTVSVPANACTVATTFTAIGSDICTLNRTTNTIVTTCNVTTTPNVAVTLTCPVVSAATGGLITYTGTVRNSGNVTLNNVVVSDNQSSPSTVLTITSLPVGAVSNFTASFITPLDTCSVSSTVSASGTDACTGVFVTTSTSTVCPLVTTPRIVVTQNCPASPANLGGVLTYSGSVSNSGNITLTNVVVTDDQTGSTSVFVLATLAPGTFANFVGSYNVPANAGCTITSTLTASGSDKCTSTRVSATATSTCPLQGAARIVVTLACPASAVPLGGTLVYSGSVSNAGNITLTNVAVTRDIPSPSTVVFTTATLAPGTSANFTGSYTVPTTNACSSTTSVTARANDQCAGATVANSTTITCPLITTPLIIITQNCPASPANPGGVLIYTGSISNAGNITLTNFVVKNDRSGATPVLTGPLLAPGATTNFSGSYNVPLTNQCSISSTATVTASDSCSGVSITNSMTSTCPLTTSPQILVTLNCPVVPAATGGLITYSGQVSNTGNVTLNNVSVVNTQSSPSTVLTVPVLPPGAFANFTTSFISPLNSCTVTATVTARGSDACTANFVTNVASATCPLITAPRLVVTENCSVTAVSPGGLLTYSGSVSNSGNITVTNVVVMNDHSGSTVIFTVPTLAPRGFANFSGSFIAPLDSCSVTSTLTASANDSCTGIPLSTNATATCSLLTAPAIAVTQNCPATLTAPGGTLTYSGSVSNPGNITLTNVVVTDDRTGSTPVYTAATLAPGVTATFTGSYVVPINSGCSVTSTLTALGSDKCTGSRVSATATSNCPLLTHPDIEVTLNCPNTPAPLGGTLVYTGSVSNSGNITLTNIVVVNNHTGTNLVFTTPSLAPGARVNFTGSYQVPENCCTVSSEVTASGRGCDGVLVKDTASSVCQTLTSPALVVTKLCPGHTTAPGQLLTYSGTISNAGNITLADITIVNSIPTNNSPVFGPVTLAPGDWMTYTGSYIVPADFCGTDTVTATGSICDKTVTNSVTTTCPIAAYAPGLSVTKNCPAIPVPRGGLFTYTGTVSNTGNVTLVNVYVVSSEPVDNTPVIGPITLAPGVSSNFTASFTAPWCCCEVFSTLDARGQDKCSLATVTARVSDVCELLSTPGLSVTEECPSSAVAIGQTYYYSGVVSNTGDVYLTNVFVYANHPGTGTIVLGPMELAPGEYEEFDDSFVVTTNTSNNVLTASGVDICQARTVSAGADCSGPFGGPTGPTILSITTSNGVATITWTASAGTTYTLQYKDHPQDAIWLNLPGNVLATGATATKNDNLGPLSGRYYRVMVQ